MRAGLLSLALLCGLGACDGGEVVVFSVTSSAGENAVAGFGAGAAPNTFAGSAGSAGGGGTSGGGGSGGNSVDKSCQTTDDCDQAWFCQKLACEDPTGVCHPIPLSDDPLPAPVCGCGNVTYWNDTLRQQKGNSASMPGSCVSGVQPCMSDDDCGSDPDARCSRRLRDLSACSIPGAGYCWVVPSDCAASDDRADLLPCPPPGPPSGPPSCMTLCQAINSGMPFIPRRKDYTCP